MQGAPGDVHLGLISQGCQKNTIGLGSQRVSLALGQVTTAFLALGFTGSQFLYWPKGLPCVFTCNFHVFFTICAQAPALHVWFAFFTSQREDAGLSGAALKLGGGDLWPFYLPQLGVSSGGPSPST